MRRQSISPPAAAPAFLARAPLLAVLTNAAALAILAIAPSLVVLTNAAALAILAVAPLPAVSAASFLYAPNHIVICDFISFLHLVGACGALDDARYGVRVILRDVNWWTYLQRPHRAVRDDTFAAEAVPAGPKHRRAPVLNPEVMEADAALKTLPAESVICGIPLRRRKNRVCAPAAPLVSTRKENQLFSLFKLGFFPTLREFFFRRRLVFAAALLLSSTQ